MAEAIEQKFELLEQELANLKTIFLKSQQQSSKKTVSIKGLWKGTKINEEEINKAKTSLFKNR